MFSYQKDGKWRRVFGKGFDFATKLESDKELFCKEKAFLQSIGRAQISDTIVEKITIKELKVKNKNKKWKIKTTRINTLKLIVSRKIKGKKCKE